MNVVLGLSRMVVIVNKRYNSIKENGTAEKEEKDRAGWWWWWIKDITATDGLAHSSPLLPPSPTYSLLLLKFHKRIAQKFGPKYSSFFWVKNCVTWQKKITLFGVDGLAHSQPLLPPPPTYSLLLLLPLLPISYSFPTHIQPLFTSKKNSVKKWLNFTRKHCFLGRAPFSVKKFNFWGKFDRTILLNSNKHATLIKQLYGKISFQIYRSGRIYGWLMGDAEENVGLCHP